MNIALVGATGNIGSRILDEALQPRPSRHRPHPRSGQARGARRPDRRSTAARPTSRRSADVLKGHDAAIVSVKWNENDVHQVLDALAQVGREALPVRGRRRQPVAQGRPHAFRPHGREGHPAADLQARGAGAGRGPEGDGPRLDGDLAARLDPARRAHRQVPPGPRSPDRGRQGREPRSAARTSPSPSSTRSRSPGTSASASRRPTRTPAWTPPTSGSSPPSPARAA